VKLGIEPWLVGSGIALIQAQRLLRCLCAECREHAVVLGMPSPDEQSGQNPPESFASHRAVGCDACHGLGYTDERILVCESMPFSDHLQQLAIEKASESELQVEAVQEGMTTLRSMALGVARKGVTTLNEVYLHTPPE